MDAEAGTFPSPIEEQPDTVGTMRVMATAAEERLTRLSGVRKQRFTGFRQADGMIPLETVGNDMRLRRDGGMTLQAGFLGRLDQQFHVAGGVGIMTGQALPLANRQMDMTLGKASGPVTGEAELRNRLLQQNLVGRRMGIMAGGTAEQERRMHALVGKRGVTLVTELGLGLGQAIKDGALLRMRYLGGIQRGMTELAAGLEREMYNLLTGESFVTGPALDRL